MKELSTGRLVAIGVVALALLVGVGVLVVRGGGTDDFALPGRPDIGEARIDVDTPALRRAKRAAGIADCRPGSGRNDLPALTLPCLGGGPAVRLDRLAGPLVVTVWANWCGPCRKELPFFERLSQRLGDRATVLGIDYKDPQPASAMDLLASSGVTFPQVADPQEELKAGPPRVVTIGLPVLVLVDGSGAITHQESGGMDSYAELAGLVEEHLGISA